MDLSTIPYKICVLGTRGKSSTVDALRKCFDRHGIDALGKRTGLIPTIEHGQKNWYVRRLDGDIVFDRHMETQFLFEELKNESVTALITENNAISLQHTYTLNVYLNPDLFVLTTTTPDHVLEQGYDPEHSAKMFLSTIPRGKKIIFWTNHSLEKETMEAALEKDTKSNVTILFSDLKYRDEMISQEVFSFFGIDYKPVKTEQKNDHLVTSEIIATLPGDKKLIDLGSVNDLLHTQLFLDDIQSQFTDRPMYLFLNIRADREDRAWLFLEYILPLVAKEYTGVIVFSEHTVFSSKYISKLIRKKYPKMNSIPCVSLDDLEDNIVPALPDKSVVMVVANTANKFGLGIIGRFKLYRESYPILNKINISQLSK